VPDESTGKLAERYDRDAQAYRDLWAPILRFAGRELLRELARERARTILDVGTGVGTLLSDLRAAFPGAQVLGVDRSRGMLALAPAASARAVMDATHLAVRSESVDLVLQAFVLFHLEDPALGLYEARRVLRPRGRLGTMTWGAELESRATRTWTACLDEHGAREADPDTLARHELVDTPEKMAALLSAAGFRAERCWAGDLERPLDLETLLRLRTSMASSRQRFESLDPAAREACLASARRRMESFAPEDFVARGRVVRAMAHA
jgi:ubiquinone/menaquinone biosynthesis C-methylase UbiE